MHIPTCESSLLDIVSFDEALAASGSSGDYDSDKWLYVPDYYTDYRYILGTRGKDPLICIGINPSTAAPGDLDNTLKSVSRIAAGNGYDSWIMFNVYAQRATDPDDMDTVLNERLHRENMRAFEYILKNVGEGVSPAVWAAWGTIIEKRPVSQGLRPRHGAPRPRIRCEVVQRGKALRQGSSASSAVLT